MCLWKRERTYLFLPFGTTLVRQPHYAGGRCADKLEEYTAVLGNRASLDSVAGTYCGVLPPNVETTLTLNAIKNSRQEKFYEFLIAFFIERLQHIIYNTSQVIYNTSQGKRFYEKLYQKKVCYNSPNYG